MSIVYLSFFKVHQSCLLCCDAPPPGVVWPLAEPGPEPELHPRTEPEPEPGEGEHSEH